MYNTRALLSLNIGAISAYFYAILCERLKIDVQILNNMYSLPPSYNREVLASSFKILLETITAKRVMNTSISFYPKAGFTLY